MSEESELLSYRLDGKVAVVSLDDGRANALSPSMIQAVHGALDRAEKEAAATVIEGREGRFCAGFDLSVMTASAESARDLVKLGAKLILRMYVHPQPLVAACSGHALAAGALLLLAADQRIGAEGPFKIGLNEVAIGMRLPRFAVELARDRLSKRHLTSATLLSRIYDPGAAVDAGYLDEVVTPDRLAAAALERAAALAELPSGVHGVTKKSLRGAMVDAMLSGLDADLADLAGPTARSKK